MSYFRVMEKVMIEKSDPEEIKAALAVANETAILGGRLEIVGKWLVGSNVEVTLKEPEEAGRIVRGRNAPSCVMCNGSRFFPIKGSVILTSFVREGELIDENDPEHPDYDPQMNAETLT